MPLSAQAVLHSELLVPRASRPACWTNGQRVDSRSAFLTRLERRERQERTYVVLVQPHLTRTAYNRARAAIDADAPDPNSRSLTLLDNLLHNARQDDQQSGGCDDSSSTALGSFRQVDGRVCGSSCRAGFAVVGASATNAGPS
jgi:hypothetical protein